MSAQDTWEGDAILREVLEAARLGTDDTTKDCVPIARGLVHVDEGTLQASIGTIPAEVNGTIVNGYFGVIDDPGYALPQEFLPEPQGKAFIRPAADQGFPKLGDNIAKRLAR
jgi:hypothetical protein